MPVDVEDLLRELAPRVLGVVARRYGDFAAAEDAVQEALLVAAERWPDAGVPEQPLGWLITTASRRLIDAARSDAARRDRESRTARADVSLDAADRDDSLVLLLMCCHPALTPASAIALTLRAVGGLTTAEIARAFLVPEATMAQRISRAKRTVAESGARFELPGPDELPERLRSALHVLYLVFNEGYVGSSGAAVTRTDLSAEAIRLTRMVRAAVPDDDEIAGLLAMMLLLDARRPARVGADGELVPLPEQDRGRWDHDLVAEGLALLDGTDGPVGEYQLQARIAAVHDRAATADATDWRSILALYTRLEALTDNPVVALNRAVAVAMVDGPEAGLATVDEVAARLGEHHRLDAVRAHLLASSGDPAGAADAFESAARRTTNLAERRYLEGEAARLRSAAGRP